MTCNRNFKNQAIMKNTLLLALALVLMYAPFAKGEMPLCNDTVKSTCAVPAQGGYDPIAAALDSLVNLSYIQKLNFSASQPASNYKPYEVPSYSDDVYAKRIAK